MFDHTLELLKSTALATLAGIVIALVGDWLWRRTRRRKDNDR